MHASLANWAKYYHGDSTSLWVQRHFSYSDRIRYYWPDLAAASAVNALRTRLAGRTIPDPVLRQYLPNLPQSAAKTDFESVLLRSVEAVLAIYHAAIEG